MIEAADSIEDILRACGVTASLLSTGEREALDRDGYVLMTGVIDDNWLHRLRDAFEAGCKKDGHAAVGKESGTRHVNDLVNRFPVFEGVYTHPRVLAAVYHVLRCAFRVGEIGGRDPLPGFGQQGLHSDWPARSKGEPYRVVTTIWLLDDFTNENGATRVVPGTHHLLGQPPKSFANPATVTPIRGPSLARQGQYWCSTVIYGTAELPTGQDARGVCCNVCSWEETSIVSQGLRSLTLSS